MTGISGRGAAAAVNGLLAALLAIALTIAA